MGYAPNGRQNRIPKWLPRGGNLYATTRRIRRWDRTRLSPQMLTLWLEAGRERLEQGIEQGNGGAGIREVEVRLLLFRTARGGGFLHLIGMDGQNFSNDTDHVERELKMKFEINIIREPSILLGMKIDCNEEKKTISLSQTYYIDSLLKHFSLANTNMVSTPMDPNVNLDEEDEEKGEKEGKDTDERGRETYVTAIRSLMYAALTTHFCDADWASNADQKLMSGYVILFAGGAITWSAKKQLTIALSTAKAEYIVATHVAKQILWHQTFCKELRIPQPTTSTIFCNNQAAITIAHHLEFHARIKHINIAIHFLHDLIESGTIDIIYVPSRENLADLFMKGLTRPLHIELTYRVGVMLE